MAWENYSLQLSLAALGLGEDWRPLV